MAQKPETRFRAKVRRFLQELSKKGPLWFEAIQQKAICGTPDYLLCIGGLFVGLELKKSEKDEPDKLQKKKLYEISKAGGMSLVAFPENWDMTAALLTELVVQAKKELTEGENDAGDRASH